MFTLYIMQSVCHGLAVMTPCSQASSPDHHKWDGVVAIKTCGVVISLPFQGLSRRKTSEKC